jgi:hypothetical protein
MSEIALWVDKLNTMQPDDIRSLMQAEGITGYIGHASECVIANFLKTKGKLSFGISVSPMFIAWVELELRAVPVSLSLLDTDTEITFEQVTRWQDHVVRPSENLGNFIARFDGSCYPELVNGQPWKPTGFNNSASANVSVGSLTTTTNWSTGTYTQTANTLVYPVNVA